MAFCVVYYKEHEQKADAQRKEQMLRITAQRQTKERETFKRTEQEIKFLRQDMLLFLNTLSLCIENDDKENSHKMIARFSSSVKSTTLKHYCKNDTINYVLSDFTAQCLKYQIKFVPTVEIAKLITDDVMFATILTNALDNALNAQKDLPPDKRMINLLIKTCDNKLLLSVQNPFKKESVFVDNMPISKKAGHGYMTPSIRYMTERLGGNCQFLLQNDTFILRVIL